MKDKEENSKESSKESSKDLSKDSSKEASLKMSRSLKLHAPTNHSSIPPKSGTESGQSSPTGTIGAELTFPTTPNGNHNTSANSISGMNHSPSSLGSFPVMPTPTSSPSAGSVLASRPYPPTPLSISGIQDRTTDGGSIWNSFLSGIGLSGKGQQTQNDKDRNLAKIQQEQIKLREKEKQNESSYGIYTSGLEYYHLFEFGSYDKLLADYTCNAMTLDTILKGKCYISQTYFSFHSQRTKQQILVVLPWSEIVDIRLAPNKPPYSIILIFTSDSKVHQFTGFQTSIDTIFNLMHFILSSAKSRREDELQNPTSDPTICLTVHPPPLENLRLEQLMSPKRGHRRAGSTVY